MYKNKVKDLIYKIIILKKLQKELSITNNVIESLEEQHVEVTIKVDEVQNSPQTLAVAQKNKIVEEELQTLKVKLAIEELEMDHSKIVIGEFGLDTSNQVKEYVWLSYSIVNVSLNHSSTDSGT